MENKNIKHIVFLDIDGVLNSEDFFKNRAHKGFIDTNKIKLLNQLKDIDTEVVISSSWGYDNGRTEKTLKDCGLELPIIGYTEHFHCSWQCRGNEIAKWLFNEFEETGNVFGENFAHYRGHDYEYVIFDDDMDYLLGQASNFINTNQYTGLTQEDIDKARKILLRSCKE